MVVSGTHQSAKLDAIAEIVGDNVKEVKIFFNEKINSWCVESVLFTEEEWDIINDM